MNLRGVVLFTPHFWALGALFVELRRARAHAVVFGRAIRIPRHTFVGMSSRAPGARRHCCAAGALASMLRIDAVAFGLPILGIACD